MTEKIAGGGLLNRWNLLKAGSIGTAATFLTPVSATESWMIELGQTLSEYGSPSKFVQYQCDMVTTLKVQSAPAYTREETGKMKLKEKGVYEISGLAWSGEGAIRKVEVSADDVLDEKSLPSVKMPNKDGFVELDNAQIFER